MSCPNHLAEVREMFIEAFLSILQLFPDFSNREQPQRRDGTWMLLFQNQLTP